MRQCFWLDIARPSNVSVACVCTCSISSWKLFSKHPNVTQVYRFEIRWVHVRHLLFFLTFPPKKQIETPAFCNLNRWRFSIVTKSRLHNQVVGWHLPRPCRRHMKDPSSWVIGHRLAMRRGTKENRVHLWSIFASLIGMQPSVLPPLSYSILRLTETSNSWMFDWIIRSAMK